MRLLRRPDPLHERASERVLDRLDEAIRRLEEIRDDLAAEEPDE